MITVKFGEGIKVAKLTDVTYLPSIVKVNSFDEPGAQKFADEFQAALNTGQPVVPVIIDSYGGEVYSLLRMIDIVKASPIPVATVVSGKAMSCGAVLATCGSGGMRWCTPSSRIMIHDVSTGSWGKISDMKGKVIEGEALNKFIYGLMEENIGAKPGTLTKAVSDRKDVDWFLSAKEAKKLNLVNHIGTPSFKMKIGLEVSFG